MKIGKNSLQYICIFCVINFGSLLYAYYANIFYSNINKVELIFFSIDIALILLITVYACTNKKWLKGVNYQLNNFSNFYFGCIFLILLAIASFDRISLISSGYTREQLVFDLPSNRLFQIISVPSLLYAATLAVKKLQHKLTIIIIMTILLLNVANTLSRTPFLIFLFSYVTVAWLSGVSIKMKNYIISLTAIIGFSAILTVMQGRSNLLLNALFDLPSLLLRYRSFSFYLHSEYLSYVKLSEENFLFPEFGFFYEKFSQLFGPLGTPIAVDGSTFVSDKVSLGPTRLTNANVNYSWLSSYYARDAAFALITKNTFAFLSLYLFKKLNLALLYYYWIMYFSFLSATRHPILNIDSAYSLIGVIIFSYVVLILPKFRVRA